MNRSEDLGLRPTVWTSPSGGNLCRISRSDIPRNLDEPFRRQMCYRCPSCIRIRSISEYSSEGTPLLASSVTFMRNSRCYDQVLIYLFFFVLAFGAGVGMYLLILESEGSIIEEFDYVSRETWGINTTFLKDIQPLQTPASKIFILRLTPNCTAESDNCLNYNEFLVDGQVLYNFYQDKNGKIFEGRGWNYQSDCGRMEGCGDILTIGLIEDSNGIPSSDQIKKLKAFLDYCIMDNALKQCYEILVRHSPNKEFDDLIFVLEEMNRKDGTCEYYT